MPSRFILSGKQYEAYVTILAGEGDGPLIWIDHAGHIHVDPEPGPGIERIEGELREAASELKSAVRRIEAAVREVSVEHVG
jgi:hypothetical protein